MVMKFYHNSFIGKVLVLFFAIAIHAYFASGAYLLGGFLGRLFLYDVPHGGVIGSYGLAILTFSGAMYAFMYLEYAREDVEAYEEQSGDGTFRRSLREIQWLIAGAELASLVYRSVQAPSIWIGCVLFFLGLIFLRLAFALGKVVHAMANRPVEVGVMQSMDKAGRTFIEKATKGVGKMDASQLKRYYRGDVGTVDEVSQPKESPQESQQEERKRQQQERWHRARNMTRQLLGGDEKNFPHAQAATQASPLSQNGNH
jgi:hypothetical protein